MNSEPKLPKRPGLKKHIRELDHKVWLWSLENSLLKKNDIKVYAKQLFNDAGILDFKASDGWYRRWSGRWKHQQHPPVDCYKKIDNEKFNIIQLNEMLLENNEISDITIENHHHHNHEPFENNIQSVINENVEQLIVNKPTQFVNKLNRKKIERYLPHFKQEVVEYAVKNSIKQAVVQFKVNKGTISDWIRANKGIINFKTAKNNLKSELRPDIEFIEWLKHERLLKNSLNKEIIKNKLQEIIELFQDTDIDKNCRWFYYYLKRFETNSNTKMPHINYPLTFKRELAEFCKFYSKNLLSEMFMVDRKRIREWCQLMNNDNLKIIKRKASNYVTDKRIDNEIWLWYQSQTIKPSSKEIREKGTELYKKASYKDIKCSSGWYYRWSARYSIKTSGELKIEYDNQLLEWLLSELDNNENVSYSKLKAKANQIQHDTEKKPSTSWAIRFCKKYSTLLQSIPNYNINLPINLENKINIFKNTIIDQLINQTNKNLLFIAFDEIALNFTSTNGTTLIRKTGFENCHASVIISCTSIGQLLQTTLILKSPLNDDEINNCSQIIVLEQKNALNDEHTIVNWFNMLFSHNKQSSILIGDHFKPHIYLKENCKEILKENHIEMVIIPGGCSSKLQPILFGLAEQFKLEIDNQWLKWNNEHCWTSVNGSHKVPTQMDIYNWVKIAHDNLANMENQQIYDSFVKAGYITL